MSAIHKPVNLLQGVIRMSRIVQKLLESRLGGTGYCSGFRISASIVWLQCSLVIGDVSLVERENQRVKS